MILSLSVSLSLTLTHTASLVQSYRSVHILYSSNIPRFAQLSYFVIFMYIHHVFSPYKSPSPSMISTPVIFSAKSKLNTRSIMPLAFTVSPAISTRDTPSISCSSSTILHTPSTKRKPLSPLSQDSVRLRTVPALIAHALLTAT